IARGAQAEVGHRDGDRDVRARLPEPAVPQLVLDRVTDHAARIELAVACDPVLLEVWHRHDLETTDGTGNARRRRIDASVRAAEERGDDHAEDHPGRHARLLARVQRGRACRDIRRYGGTEGQSAWSAIAGSSAAARRAGTTPATSPIPTSTANARSARPSD